ncbi:MAG TPA: DUF4383 domain-containing protein [Allosphingosinicella sp.]|jgi:hypothetical protein|nr:DUF4383 domain-containing protein [Allosphingosinicella sp.]
MNTRTFALIFGIVFLVIGAGGFIPDILQPGVPDPNLTMTHGYGHELGLFPVNTLHNIVHIIFGIWGILAYKSYGGSRSYFRVVAVVYGLLTVLGLLEPTRTTFGLVPIYDNDVWLHALLALVAAYFGWVNRDTAGDRG